MDTKDDSWQTQPYRVRIAAGGRIVIPAEVRQYLQVKEGDELLLTREVDGFRLSTVRQTVKEIQAFFSRFKKPGENVVKDFLRERREEAAKEERESGSKRRERSK